ncbi:MAG: Na(+)-translocating NADH-quinone reductase subunit A [Thalassolituus sp.]|jgi:Na+-transporting NADH:ubiquinone oxidoreductase subunit A|uniref:Na(+)-translocating NADH-quinone reductase subunit A n=3 Tax=root TaxID=1 RepID=M5DRE4_9GAMM|nr:Na(+)-translocating NADH-quinone reductase subunit A [Thalassolituus oleivorans]PCI49130.1 MAG: NADH:ubiquinone reductase (Na(+)-transporting) subunit A [Oceanospirillales bacterium]PHQ87886.1 MAG: NADH:ubiquinone reductase (Na(+)-transporting) subunit A [Thalassobium sp.]AHK15637.1 Na(+)-translocating NADH-quinone reductase subunit A [Thalassolituus oleivorans R6-15]APR66853.1 NADH:ubiquinone reductase (Na(+)-transporting) subunit A [Thalassolituus oleivorans]MBQ0727564.1 Na(+)-translocati
MINIKKGLDLPITGNPEQTITDGPKVTQVAVMGPDYVGMKPTMAVQEGDRVKKGQVLFTDKKTEGVQYTAPAAGVVKAINRGARRVFLSVVIELDGDEEETFTSYTPEQLNSLDAKDVEANLVASGLWTALRTRPYSKVPALGSRPKAIFVNAMDTNPLAGNPELVIKGQTEAFKNGLRALRRLSEGKLFVCKAPGASIPSAGVEQTEEFAGPHPAGLPGTHIHFLYAASANRTVWTVGYQDVIAIGKLFTTGKLFTDRVIALAGPQVNKPRLVRTQLGASLAEVTKGELKDGENRLISGSVFGGRTASGELNFLGRFHNQVSVLREGRERPMLHYLTPGTNRFSVMPIYLSKLMSKVFDFTTTTNGSERAMVPVGSYERIMPLDILPTQLLRALIVEDMESAIALGALELDEEDIALCSFVCPGKYEYGPILRKNLTRIEAEG